MYVCKKKKIPSGLKCIFFFDVKFGKLQPATCRDRNNHNHFDNVQYT